MKKSKTTYAIVHTLKKAADNHTKKIRTRGGKVQRKTWGTQDIMLTYHFNK